MRIVFIVLAVAATVILAAGAGLYVVLRTTDLAALQGIAARVVENATGRTLAIDGALCISPSLRPTLVVEGVRFANVAGAAEPDMVRIERLEARVRLLPLLRGEVRLDSLLVTGARIELSIDSSGTPNWRVVLRPGQRLPRERRRPRLRCFRRPGVAAGRGYCLPPRSRRLPTAVRAPLGTRGFGGGAGRPCDLR